MEVLHAFTIFFETIVCSWAVVLGLMVDFLFVLETHLINAFTLLLLQKTHMELAFSGYFFFPIFLRKRIIKLRF